MKKSVGLFFTMVLFTAFSYAQPALQQGTKTLGGTVGFMTSTTDSDYGTRSETQFNFNPIISTFLTDDFEIGGFLSLEYYSTEYSSSFSNSSTTSSSKQYGVGVLGNKYFPLNDSKAFYIGAGGSLYANPDIEEKLLNFYGQGGLLIFLNDYAAVNFGAQYSVFKGTISESKLTVLSFVIGMKYFFF